MIGRLLRSNKFKSVDFNASGKTKVLPDKVDNNEDVDANCYEQKRYHYCFPCHMYAII